MLNSQIWNLNFCVRLILENSEYSNVRTSSSPMHIIYEINKKLKFVFRFMGQSPIKLKGRKNVLICNKHIPSLCVFSFFVKKKKMFTWKTNKLRNSIHSNKHQRTWDQVLQLSLCSSCHFVVFFFVFVFFKNFVSKQYWRPNVLHRLQRINTQTSWANYSENFKRPEAENFNHS